LYSLQSPVQKGEGVMMQSKIRVPLFLAACVSMIFLALGCEDKPDTENVDDYFDGQDLTANVDALRNFPQTAAPLTPDQEPLVIGPDGVIQIESDGQIVGITLSGAVGSVTWRVAETTRGELVTRSQLGATYRRKAGGDNVVNATDSAGRSVSKVISQPAAQLQDFALVPAGATDLDPGGLITELTLDAPLKVAELKVVGGTGPITWSVANGTGVLITQSNAGATYQRTSAAAGDNVVTATDDRTGRQAYKVIRQINP
jgi:hypothetical protein